MTSLWSDLRYGARMIRKTPGPSLIAVFALAFGIGLTTLMFSIIYGALMRGLPFDEQHELVRIVRTNATGGEMRINTQDYFDWRSQNRSFEDLAAFGTTTFNLGIEGSVAERLDGATMTSSVFRLLGVSPVMGRVFNEEEDRPGGPNLLIIGWGVWQQRFGGDPSAIGRTVRVNGEEAVIIGVMPNGFGFPAAQNAWMPLRPDPSEPRSSGGSLRVMGRLRDGVTLERALAEFAALGQRIAQQFPETDENVSLSVEGYTEDMIGAEERTVLYTMFGAVVFVLLIACANVANLLIGRAMVRTREIGVRTALGASRLRVVMQFLTESLALAIGGALAGTLIAAIGIRWFNAAIAGTRPPFWILIRLDAPVLLVTGLATLTAALAAGAIPALQAARANTQDILKDESRGTSSFRLGRLSRILVAAEIALSVFLLVGAGLMIKSVTRLYTVDMGFDADHIFHGRLFLPPNVPMEPEQQLGFAQDLHTRLSALPGIESVALASTAPGFGSPRFPFVLEGVNYPTERDYPASSSVTVSEDFFSMLGVQPVSGRTFGSMDVEGALRVAIVNRSFEQRFFPTESAIGKRFRFAPFQAGADTASAPRWLTIVGVVPDLYANDIENEQPDAIYRPITQAPMRGFAILARTRAQPAASTAGVREALASADPDIALSVTGSLKDVIRRDNWFYGVFGTLFVIFGLSALFLAAIGLYGVMAFSVSRRRREMGVRLAIGASSRDVLTLVFRQGMIQTAIGLAIGTLFSLAVSSLLAAILFQVEPRDPAIFAAIVLVLLATAALACAIPALRASRTAPLEALRYE
jgi:predicted permease